MLTRKIMFAALIGACPMIPPAYAQVEAPAGYPVIEEQSIPLLQLDYGGSNPIDGENVHSMVTSDIAYSPDHDVFLHVWLADLHPANDGDDGLEQAIYYQLFDRESGLAIAEPRIRHLIDIWSGGSDPSRLNPHPEMPSTYLYRLTANSLTTVYDPDSQSFLTTWTSMLTNTPTPNPGEPSAEELAGYATLGFAVSQIGDNWIASTVLPVNWGSETVPNFLSPIGSNAQSFSREGLSGLHRFEKTSSGDVRAAHLVYDSGGEFQVAGSYLIPVSEEIPQFDNGSAFDPKPLRTLNFNVAYDAGYNHYSIVAVRLESLEVLSIEPGQPREFRFFTAVTEHRLDAELITDNNASVPRLRRVLALSEPDQFIQVYDDPTGPPARQFESAGVAWQPADGSARTKMHFFWTKREMTDLGDPDEDGVNNGVAVSDDMTQAVQRFRPDHAGNFDTVDPESITFPESVRITPLQYRPVGHWDAGAGVITFAWGSPYAVNLHAIPATNGGLVEAPPVFTVEPGFVPHISTSFNNVAPEFLDTDGGIYMYLSGASGAALRVIDWQWVDLATQSSMIGPSDTAIPAGAEFTIELIVSNLDIGDLATNHDSGAFTVTVQAPDSVTLVSVDDRLSGNLAEGFTIDPAAAISAGGTGAFDFVFRNDNDSGDDQAIELDMAVTANEQFDYNAENDASQTSFTLSASADDSGDDDDTEDDDTGNGTDNDDSGNGSGDGSGDGSGNGPGDNTGSGSGSGSTDGGSGGGGALFWLIAALGFPRLRR